LRRKILAFTRLNRCLICLVFELGDASKKLISFFENSKIWMILDSVIGLVMIWIAAGLVIFVYQNLFI
jgi:arginine exporter protein ArgO